MTWKAVEPEGTVKIWASTTNHFEEGKRDDYRLVAEVPAKTEAAAFSVPANTKGFYKIVLEGKYNHLTRWIVE